MPYLPPNRPRPIRLDKELALASVPLWELTEREIAHRADVLCARRYINVRAKALCVEDRMGGWRAAKITAASYGLLSEEETTELRQHSTPLETLPKRLYHVTTNLPAVLRTGIRSRRRAVNFGVACGLGGGSSTSISFSDDYRTARNIRSGILGFTRLMRTPKRAIPEMWKTATSGRGALHPWASETLYRLAEIYPDTVRPSGAAPTAEAKRQATYALRRLGCSSRRRGGDLRALVIAGLLLNDSHPVYRSDGYCAADKALYLPSPKRPRISGCTEVQKCAETTHDCGYQLYAFWEAWAKSRQLAGGPPDPVFCAVRRHKWKTIRPKDVAILTFAPCPGARGTHAGDDFNREWKAWRPHTVRLVAVDGKRPPGGTKPSLLKCPKIYTMQDIKKPSKRA